MSLLALNAQQMCGMPFPLLDRSKLHLHSLDERDTTVDILRHAGTMMPNPGNRI